MKTGQLNTTGLAKNLKHKKIWSYRGMALFGKCAIFFVCMTLLAGAASAGVANAFVTQSGAPSGNCTTNVQPVTWFDSGANWGAGASQIGPGTTVHICGTITSVLTPQGSGASGNPIVIQWEPGASLAVCNTTGALQIGNNFLIFDLGGNSAAITCPNNGIGMGSAVNAVGVTDLGNGFSNVEIRNGTIGPMFVYSGGTNSGFSSGCLIVNTNSIANHFHNLTLKGCANTIINGLGPNSGAGSEIDHNTVDGSDGRFVNYASQIDGGNYTDTGGSIHDNDVNYSSVWAVSGGFQHFEIIHVYNRGTGSGTDHIVNLQIYNNYFHGTTPNNSGSTAGIFIGEGGSTCSTNSSVSVSIFNNLFKNTKGGIGWSSGSGGFIYDQDCEHTMAIYNNTIDGGDTATDSCFEILSQSTGNTWILSNNICMNVQFGIYNPQGNSPSSFTSDHNLFFNLDWNGFGGMQWHNTAFATLAGWQGASGQDAHSLSVNPGLNADYTISSASSPVVQAGANLTSLNISALNTGKPLIVGAGSSGVGNARSGAGNWDLGVYPWNNGAKPNPATSLTVTTVK